MGQLHDMRLTRFLDGVTRASIAEVLAIMHYMFATQKILGNGRATSVRLVMPSRTEDCTSTAREDGIDDALLAERLLHYDAAWSVAIVKFQFECAEYSEEWTLSLGRRCFSLACYLRSRDHEREGDETVAMLDSLLKAGLVDVAGSEWLGRKGVCIGTAEALYIEAKIRRLPEVAPRVRPSFEPGLNSAVTPLRRQLRSALARDPELGGTVRIPMRGSATTRFLRRCDECVVKKIGHPVARNLIERSVGVSLEQWLQASK